MGLRRAHCYRWDSPAYTRVSNTPANSFVTGIPGIKITHFDMGDPNGDFEVRLDMISDEDIQIRHNALEAGRQTAVRLLEKDAGKKEFYFKIRVYPHHIMRENKMATGAGADRVQSGMRDSFGKPVGKAARVHKNQIIMSIYLAASKVDVAREAFRKAKAKLPGASHVEEVELKKKAKASA
jgi:large subunit ribosomal protein L10e